MKFVSSERGKAFLVAITQPIDLFPVTRTCSESTNTNGTYFQNRAYPSTFDTVGSCQLTVDKANDNVCQLRYFALSVEESKHFHLFLVV